MGDMDLEERTRRREEIVSRLYRVGKPDLQPPA
jgi:hypothetical protein